MANCLVWSFNLKKAKAAGYKATFTDWLISLRSNRIHSEFQFSQRYDCISFSSTLKDGENGPRFKQITYSHPEYWDKQAIPMTDSQEDEAFRYAQDMIDYRFKYDLIGLLSFATKWQIILPCRWRVWCSECITMLIMHEHKDFYLMTFPNEKLVQVFHLEQGEADDLNPDGLWYEIEKRWTKQ